MRREFPLGEYAEEMPWAIETEYEIEADCPCAHATKIGQGSYGGRTKYRIPRVVVARNEGGYNGTIVCLDCILEAAQG